MLLFTILLALAASAFAIPTDTVSARQGSFSGVATFNDYQKQGPTVCNPGGGSKSYKHDSLTNRTSSKTCLSVSL